MEASSLFRYIPMVEPYFVDKLYGACNYVIVGDAKKEIRKIKNKEI